MRTLWHALMAHHIKLQPKLDVAELVEVAVITPGVGLRIAAHVGKVGGPGLLLHMPIWSILRCLRVRSVSGGDYAVDPGGRHVSEIVFDLVD